MYSDSNVPHFELNRAASEPCGMICDHMVTKHVRLTKCAAKQAFVKL